MGFTLKKLPDGVNVFELSAKGDEKVTFMQCAVTVLKKQEFAIAVDVTAHPPSIAEITAELVKLQGAVRQKGKSIQVQGVTREVFDGLGPVVIQAGVEFKGITAGTAAVEQGPPGEPLDVLLQRYKDALDQAIRTRHSLLREKDAYEHRLKELSTFAGMSEATSAGIKEIQDAQAEMTRLDQGKVELLKSFEELSKKKATEEEATKKAIADLTAKGKEKLKPLLKKITDLEKQRDKLLADISKKQSAAKPK